MKMKLRQQGDRQGTPPLRQSFLRREDGNLTIFALCMFTLMVMMGGIAVDLMRYETTRTTLQNTLDRATLASASLSQRLDAAAVVNDYFDKAGMAQYLRSVTVDEGMNYRLVTADAAAATDPFFLHMIGIESMDAPGHSMAEQRMTNVDIVLVLDVSGSMGSNSRLTNLKVAAKEFVNTVLSSDEEDRISVTLVPFSENVNLPLVLRQKYNATYTHNVANVNCLELPNTVFSESGIARTTPLPMFPAADAYNSTTRNSSYISRTDSSKAVPLSADWACTAKPQNAVVLPSKDIAYLQGKIDGLQADSMTSINLGMKWGMAMIDPGTRSIFSELASAGQIPLVFNDRPFEYDDPESMKVIVLMTDGENTQGELVADQYKAGVSPIFKSPLDGNYSIRFTTGRPGVAGAKEYWVPHRSEWRAKPWTNTSDTGADALAGTPMDWKTVWSEVRLQWVVWQLYARALGTNDSQRAAQWNIWYPEFHSSTVPATMNTQLQSMCALAKQKGVTVYGIAFEAPTVGQQQISQCATSSAHYFNASGLQISTAFRAIANNISHLRLTQ